MKRYLTEEQMKANIKIGRSVEQWLGFTQDNDVTILKWLRVDKEKDGSYSLSYFESIDEGNSSLLDIYEFSQLDPDEPFGVINSFTSIDEMLEFAVQKYNGSNLKYLPAGMIQEEYNDYLHR